MRDPKVDGEVSRAQSLLRAVEEAPANAAQDNCLREAVEAGSAQALATKERGSRAGAWPKLLPQTQETEIDRADVQGAHQVGCSLLSISEQRSTRGKEALQLQ